MQLLSSFTILFLVGISSSMVGAQSDSFSPSMAATTMPTPTSTSMVQTGINSSMVLVSTLTAPSNGSNLTSMIADVTSMMILTSSLGPSPNGSSMPTNFSVEPSLTNSMPTPTSTHGSAPNGTDTNPIMTATLSVVPSFTGSMQASTSNTSYTPTVSPSQSVTVQPPASTTASPSSSGKPNVGLAVGLSVTVLVVMSVVVGIAIYYIYKRYARYHGSYTPLETHS